MSIVLFGKQPIRGFTLIELLIVIAIIGLLTSIVLASLNSVRDRARIAAALQFESHIYHGIGDQLIGSWGFDECSGATANDGSGLGNTGTLINSPVWSTNTPANNGCSLSFNGSNTYVNVGNSAQLNPSSAMTISLWINANAYALGVPVGRRNNGDYADVYSFKWRATENPFWTIRDGSDVAHFLTLASLPALNEWHHIAMTYDGQTMRSYLNGVPDGNPLSFVNTIQASTRPTLIGQSVEFFPGNIDNVRIYSSVLTAQAVQKLYAEGAAEHGIALQ